MVIIIIGVSGSGKTTVGQQLAELLDWNFYDADDYHTKDNIKKMKKGIPLSDADREPWLHILSKKIAGWQSGKKNAVLACSALKKQYRNILGVDRKDVKTVLLKGTFSLYEKRLKSRKNHFANINLLQSQIDILEKPDSGLIIDIADTPVDICKKIIETFELEDQGR